MVGTKTFAALASALFLLFGTVTSAGILDDHPAAYNDGNGPGTDNRWAGSSPFTDGFDLNGYVDFAVFTADAFNNPINGVSGLGYAPADALVYAYQVFNDGPDVISAQLTGVVNPASAIGTFNIGDVDASGMDLSGGIAMWEFFTPGIGTAESSYGLAFSSPNKPEMGVSLTIDGGSNALAEVPTPSSNPIPEPASMLLLSCGGLLMFVLRRRRN